MSNDAGRKSEHKPGRPDELPITIDQQPHRSPSPTTGMALYALGSISAKYDLYRENRGPGDDEFIPRTDAKVVLKPGEHFYSAQATLTPGESEPFGDPS